MGLFCPVGYKGAPWLLYEDEFDWPCMPGGREGESAAPSLLPSLLAKGVEMSLTGPACEDGGKERGKKNPGYFLPSLLLL